MKKTHSYILIFFTVILITITVGVSWFRDLESRRVEGERFLFPELGISTDENALKMLNNITEIRINSSKELFSILRENDNWVIPDLANFPVSVDKIKRVIVGIAQLETIESKTKNSDLHGILGLNDPSSENAPAISVSLIGDENKTLAALYVGKDSKSGKDTRYIRRPDENQTWLAWRNFELPDTKIGWLDDTLFSIARWRVADIKIIHQDEPEVFIKRADYSEQYFKIQNLSNDILPLNPYVGNQIGSAIEKLPVKNVSLKENISISNLVTTEYTTFDGLRIIIDNFVFNDKKWVKFRSEFDKNLRRELPKDGPNIVGLPEMPSMKEVKEESELLNKKVSKWAFQFPKSKHVQFTTSLKDIIKKKDIEK